MTTYATIAADATATASDAVYQVPGQACAQIVSLQYDSGIISLTLLGKTKRCNAAATGLDDGNFYNCRPPFSSDIQFALR